MMNRRPFSNRQQYSVDNPVNYTLLLIVSFLFWFAGYRLSAGFPPDAETGPAPLWKLLCRIWTGRAPLYLTGLLLAVGSAFLIHRANYMLMIIREKTLMPFLLYILLISSNPDFFPLNSTSAGIFCLILSFYQLFTSYHDSGAVRKSFNASFFIGIGSLLWVHILWFLPLFWWGMYNFKALTLRTFLSSLTGAGFVYWFLFGWCVLRHDFTPLAATFAPLLNAGLPAGFDASRLIEWIQILYIAFITTIATVNILLHEYDDSLRTRQYLSFLIMFLAASAALFLFYGQSSGEMLNAACIPASILISHFFTVEKGRKRLWLYYIFMILFILVSFMRSSWMHLLNTVI
jgi:hypothetical protein